MARIENSTISGNHSDSDGGGIYNARTLIAVNSRITSNTAGGQGGGIFLTETASLTLLRTNVAGNTPNDIWPID